MTTISVAVITAVALVLALLGAISTLSRRRIGLAHLVVAGVLEALLLIQASVAAGQLIGGRRPDEPATFLGYLAGIVLVPVAGTLWARTEPTRWAGTVIGVAGLVVAVMAWRLLQLWETSGA